MAKRPLTAAQLQHNRDIARKGGQATAAKYGGYHFAHVARSARARGMYVHPPIKAPFAALKAKQAALRAQKIAAGLLKPRTSRAGVTPKTTTTQTRSRLTGTGPLTVTVKKTGSLSSQGGSVFSRSTFATTKPPRRRKPAVR